MAKFFASGDNFLAVSLKDTGKLIGLIAIERREEPEERTFTIANTEIMEYSCEENNRSLWEGRIKIWQVPGSEALRPFGK